MPDYFQLLGAAIRTAQQVGPATRWLKATKKKRNPPTRSDWIPPSVKYKHTKEDLAYFKRLDQRIVMRQLDKIAARGELTDKQRRMQGKLRRSLSLDA